MKLWNAALGMAPIMRSAIWPSLNRMNVGMLDTWNLIGDLLVLVDVQLGDPDLAVHLVGELVEHRRHHAAGAAPGRPRSPPGPACPT